MDKLVFTLVSDYLPDTDIVNLSLLNKSFDFLKSKLKDRYKFNPGTKDFLIKYNILKIKIIYFSDEVDIFRQLRKTNYEYYTQVDAEILYFKRIIFGSGFPKIIDLNKLK